MPGPQTWRPILWPEEWSKPETLELVKGTAINCLAIPWPEAGAAKPIVAEAKRAGLDVVALVREGTDATPPGLPAIHWQPRESVNWSSEGAVLSIAGGAWPRVAVKEGSDALDAGPTGLPWIDSNGWFIQLAKAKAPGKVIWVQFDPPKSPEVIRSAAYSVAVSDCEAYGARWIITLDPSLRAGLISGNSGAQNTWRKLTQALSFFPGPGAEELQPQGVLGALSDFSGDNELLSHEFLNLIAREYTPTRILLKSSVTPASFRELRMVVYLDKEPLGSELNDTLKKFVQAGGTVMMAPVADPGVGSPREEITGLEYEIRSFGKGRLVVGREAFEDPYRVAADAHVLLGREHDLMRFANAGSMNASLTARPDGKHARLCIVNYAGRPGLDPVTVTLLHPYRSARFRSLEHPDLTDLPVHKEYDRTALYLPPFSVCAVLELEM